MRITGEYVAYGSSHARRPNSNRRVNSIHELNRLREAAAYWREYAILADPSGEVRKELEAKPGVIRPLPPFD